MDDKLKKQRAVLAAASRPPADLDRYNEAERAELEAIYQRCLTPGATERIDAAFDQFTAAHRDRLAALKAVDAEEEATEPAPPQQPAAAVSPE